MPFFSIIIPCYNQAIWLSEAIDSILSQEFEDWEAIIINDGSTDNTQEVGESYMRRDNRIVVYQQSNGGLSSARNTGIKHASGKWIDFLDADDYYLPGCLIEVYRKISDPDDADIIQCGFIMVDETRDIIAEKKMMAEEGLLIDSVFKGNPGPCQSIFINRDFVSELGPFDTTLRSAEDWDFWIRAAKAGAVRKIISEPLVAYRQLHNSMSKNPWTMYSNTLEVISRRKIRDTRISILSSHNVERPMDDNISIKHRLIQCVGLAVMQKKNAEALDYLREESLKYDFQFQPAEFSVMNSFLTFRHWYRKADLENVLTLYPSNYKKFFLSCGFSPKFSDLAVRHVFAFHNKNLNQYSGIPGKLKNVFLNLILNRKVKPEKVY